MCNNQFAPADDAAAVDPVFVERVRRTMMGDLLWLAGLIDGLGSEPCVCGGGVACLT